MGSETERSLDDARQGTRLDFIAVMMGSHVDIAGSEVRQHPMTSLPVPFRLHILHGLYGHLEQVTKEAAATAGGGAARTLVIKEMVKGTGVGQG